MPVGGTRTFAELLTIAGCVLPFCIGGLGLIALAVFMMYTIHRQWRPPDATTLAEGWEQLQEQLDEMVAQLRPWSSEGLTDLAAGWRARWWRIGRDLNARGTIPSRSDPDGPSWVAFGLKVRGARRPDGHLLARTTEQSFAYRITPDSVMIQVDGEPWGSIRLDGILLDAEEQPIGSAPRPKRSPIRFSIGPITRLRDARERSYPVTIRGETIGHLACPPARLKGVIHLRRRALTPAITLEGSPSREVEIWLLSLAILQIAGYNLMETAWID